MLTNSQPDAFAATLLPERSVKQLPGGLDKTPVFNSNSPEVVGRDGILLSTFSPRGNRVCHLNYPISGNFEVFAHHISNALISGHKDDLYIGILVGNASDKKVILKISRAASYLSQPDAPFIKLPQLLESNGEELIYAGPGDRVCTEFLADKIAGGSEETIELPPGKTVVIKKLPIPLNGLTPPINGRCLLMRLNASGPVYLASIARFGKTGQAPEDREFVDLLENGSLVEPRDIAPSDFDKPGPIRYGRVAGVSLGASWQGTLSVPPVGSTFFYPISALQGGTFGTGRIDSAPMAVRYPDTAYLGNGNYAVQYLLDLPLANTGKRPLAVEIGLGCPLKSDSQSPDLKYLDPPGSAVFFRGTIRIKDGQSVALKHLVLHNGEPGPPLSRIIVPPGKPRRIEISLIYPPDATPPQVLFVRSCAVK
ncbi:MAG: DUF3370 domain-containing protein [Candidatus Obscuribacterales bacterium]|nr:DUF3370 domain-containing protein [Candidatus Obscuribacterales bacterium]